MGEQTWTVVQFEEDCSVEAVLSSWIQGNFCHWSTFSKDKVMVAIRKHETLNTCWPAHKIKNFRNSTFSDYSKARSKASLAEFTSDLNSEIEDNTKRKRTKKTISSSSSEENLRTSVLPSPPTLKKKSKIQHKNVKSNYDPPIQSTLYDTENSTTSTATCCDKPNEKTLKNLLTQNYLIRSMVMDVLSEVKEIKLQLKDQQTNTNKKERTVSIFSNKELNFPLQTEEDFQTVERILENENEFINAINELQGIGGNNGYEFCKRALSMILTNKLAEKYSFFGRKKKKSFCNLNICKAVINASKEGGHRSNTKEAEKNIAGWLRRAAERGKKNI